MAVHFPLRVSANRRFLVHADGRPFFYLGDTAWELFHRLNREEAIRYLDNRARKGFTVIQAVALAELDGLTEPNAYGHLPFAGGDPARPDPRYWTHVDFVVEQANQRGLILGFLPTWGRYWKDDPALFGPDRADAYGEWLGRRYRDAGLIWILGGDRSIDTDLHRETARRMAQGLRRGDGGAHLCTFHPPGGTGSSQWFHEAPWLDFNMRQNGHAVEFSGRYSHTRGDYDRAPVKPVLDGEPIYEDHPIAFDAGRWGHSLACDVRRALYWDLFCGAFGHTYGHHSVWQMWAPGRRAINSPLMPWFEAIDQPGAGQMQYGRWLMESRPFLTRIPDDSVLVADRVPTAVPGAGPYRFAATRDESGRYAMVYAPVGRRFHVRMDRVSGSKVRAWWFDPRRGTAAPIGTFENRGERAFSPPDPGESLDWVLVLDDAGSRFPPPGQRPSR